MVFFDSCIVLKSERSSLYLILLRSLLDIY